MARFKPYDYRQGLMVPFDLAKQLPPGTLEHALHVLVEERIAEEWFEDLYTNEETGRPAYSPRLLLKVILLGYARGILGSRPLERACRENVTFLALSCGERPDHSTIAGFVGKLQGRIGVIFSEILLACHEEGLLSGTHLSLDGLKLPGNASREWSGRFEDLRWKADKLRRKLEEKLAEHRRQDKLDHKRPERRTAEQARVEESVAKLRRRMERIEEFLAHNEPKQGVQGKEIQSNVTDNESARMATSHGVIQGYNAQALVDGSHQVIVHAQASGQGQDGHQVAPILEGAQETLGLAGLEANLAGIQLSADANYHSEANLEACEALQVDAYIPDTHYRRRDPRFARRHEETAKNHNGRFGLERFTYQPDSDTYLCPQGQVLTCQSRAHASGDGHYYRRYRSRARDCAGCPFKSQCIARGGARRLLAVPLPELDSPAASLSARMRAKIDTPRARAIYARRLAIVEPVFANLRHNKGLNRFTYRGLEKVNVQWLLFCLVHNLEKIARHGKEYLRRVHRHLFVMSLQVSYVLCPSCHYFRAPSHRFRSHSRLASLH
jgi:transposase